MANFDRRATGAVATTPGPVTPVRLTVSQHAPMVIHPPVIPQKPILEKRTYSSAMSYIGITRRFTRWARHVTVPRATPLKTPGTAARIIGVVLGVFAWLFAVSAIVFMYMLVTAWYFIVFGLFGILTFPWRLHRRSQRRTQHLAEAQLAATQALLMQQQQRW